MQHGALDTARDPQTGEHRSDHRRGQDVGRQLFGPAHGNERDADNHQHQFDQQAADERPAPADARQALGLRRHGGPASPPENHPRPECR